MGEQLHQVEGPGFSLIRYQSLLTLGTELEDIERGHMKFRAFEGGPLKTSSVK